MSPDGQRVLLMRRDKWPDDVHYGKYVGLGGHVEPDEDVVGCIRREITEESGLHAGQVVLRGTILWTGFGYRRLNILCFIFRVDTFQGSAHDGNDEGTLEWVDLSKLTSVPMWESDHQWLPLVFDQDPRQFHGVMPYDGEKMINWSYQRI
jgi:8-oxo-dGTP diphosphatase